MKAGTVLVALAGAVILIAMAGCETTPTQQGALVGGMLGAGGGAIIGNQFHHSAGTGALIGGLGGAAAGALIGEQRGKAGGVKPSPSAPPPPPAPGPTASDHGHYENRTVTTQSGETYEERVWVPDQ